MKTQYDSNYFKSKTFFVLILIIGIGIFSVYTITEGHNWGDDFAMYILHAQNIAEGDPYDETGLILHEFSGTYSPQNYPPGFPILLAPVYTIFGLDFYVMKLYMVFWFLLFLCLIYLNFRDKLKYPWTVFIILIIGMSPFFRDFKENIVSDLPAVCFLLLAIYLDEKRRQHPQKQYFIYLLAFIIWFGASVRTTGILILPAILLFEYLKWKDIKKLSWKLTLIVVGLSILQMILFPGSKYSEILLFGFGDNNFSFIADEIFGRANNYLKSFSGITHLPYIAPMNTNLNELLFWVFHITAAVGLYKCMRDKISPVEIFVIFYMLVIFIFPGYQGARYLIPVIPFYFYYSMYAISSLQFKWLSVSLISIILICLFFIYNDDHNRMPHQEVTEGIHLDHSLKAFEFINSSTPEVAVLMCAKPRAFSLFTNRNATVFPNKKYKDKLYEVIDKNKVNYIISWRYDHSEYKMELENNSHGKFEKVWSNEMFIIYKVL